MKSKTPPASWSRRDFLRLGAGLGGLGLLTGTGLAADLFSLPFQNGQRPLQAFPHKRPLIVQAKRPPLLETPLSVFDQGALTPNDAFYVRWHLTEIPSHVNTGRFRLNVRGQVKTPLSLSLQDLKHQFETVELVAVNQCSGNSRGFFQPRVPGGQWGNGAMGNARWTGVRLKDVLDRAGVLPQALQVRFNGLDKGALSDTPDFMKSLAVDHARDGEVMLAYAMNGEPLPLLNGFPLRLVVPGWYATYWVKMLNDIEVLTRPDDNFWMTKAYLIPDTPHGAMTPGQQGIKMVPISRMNPRSFITNLQDGVLVHAGQHVQVRGIAFGGDSGVAQVFFSADGGQHWESARLGQDLGKYSFRQWEASFVPLQAGEYRLMVKTINQQGTGQPATAVWNPGGFMQNAIESIQIRAV